MTNLDPPFHQEKHLDCDCIDIWDADFRDMEDWPEPSRVIVCKKCIDVEMGDRGLHLRRDQ